jgi:hypothetical protein
MSDNTHIKARTSLLTLSKIFWCFMVSFFALTMEAQAQSDSSVKATVDTTSIRLGEQINYLLEVQAEKGKVVVFPEGQTFNPLEVIESYPVDTSFADIKMTLIKKYGLTQFDSGSYRIPSQKIIIGEKTMQTDTFRIEVSNVVLDTVKQGLYDIKPAIRLPKDYSNWWKYVLWILPVVLAIGAFLYWLIKRNKKQKEAEKYVPPFDQALASLKSLDESGFIASQKYKEYYTVLTDTIRRYYDEKVYDHALESTTDELIQKLNEERSSGHIDFNPVTIAALKDIFKRADLVKFARINPPEGKAQADRLAIEEIVKETKEVLPEPTVEELMQREDYREALSRKRKRKLWLSGIGGVVGILLLATGIGVIVKGYDDVRDFIFGNVTRELAEGTWINSEYGFPGMVVSSPEVLERMTVPLPEEAKGKMEVTAFSWETDPQAISIAVFQFGFPKETEINVEELITSQLAQMEADGFTANIVKNEKYSTPNGAEGVKTFGTGTVVVNKKKGTTISGEYTLLTFQAENIVQQLFISWQEDDVYSKQIAERVLNNVELQKAKAE